MESLQIPNLHTPKLKVQLALIHIADRARFSLVICRWLFLEIRILASNLSQKYVALSANVNKLVGNHDIKFGWNYLRTRVDGVETRRLQNQLFATASDFTTFGAATSGVYLLAATVAE